MPTTKSTSPLPSSEPRAPTHSRSHSSKKPSSKSRHGPESKSKTTSGKKSGKNGGETAGASAHHSGRQKGTHTGSGSPEVPHGPGSEVYDEEAPPQREIRQKGDGIDWSLFPYALAGFAIGLLVGIIFVVFFGFCCCIFSDWRAIWYDRTKRAFLGGFAAGVLVAIIVWVALFIALVVDD